MISGIKPTYIAFSGYWTVFIQKSFEAGKESSESIETRVKNVFEEEKRKRKTSTVADGKWQPRLLRTST